TRDLALIAKNIIKNFPEYYNLYSMKSFYYNKIRQYNRNKLLGKFGVDGMKTGFTDESGYGVVLSAKKDDRRVILVINGLASVDARTKEGQKLILYGLNNFVNKKVYTANSVVTKVDIAKGK
ncbi:MAG: D-alanyl-D-alanine carboxypeptidase family protein, partial [Pirellulaceae bacterium]